MRPEVARLFLIGLTAIVVIAGLSLTAFVGSGWLAGGGDKDVPTVMVLSRETLRAGIDANLEAADAREDLINGIRKQVEAEHAAGKGGRGGVAQNDAGSDAAEEKSGEPERQQAKRLEMMSLAIQDQLGTAVVQALSNSRRFKPLPMSKVSSELADARKSGTVPEEQPVVSVTTSQGGRNGRSGTGVNSSSTVAEPVKAGIKELAERLKADYTMVVSIGEPSMSYDLIDGDAYTPARFVLSAQPVISAELYSNSGKEFLPLQKMFDRRISATVALDSQLPNYGNVRIAVDRVRNEVAQVAAQEILAWILNNVAPARILENGKEMVINRGSNDGIVVGAVYDVERETGDTFTERKDEDDETGTDLGRLRQPVGSIVIKSVQDRIATAAKASGGPFAKGDLVKVVAMVPGAAASGGRSGGGSDAVPLGARAMAQADAARSQGIAQRQANVAVNFVTLNGRDASSGLGQTLAEALAKDPRITVLPRSELGKLVNERRLNAIASNDYENIGVQGMIASAYLISADFRSASSRRAKTITVGGVTETVSTSTVTTVSGTLRATSVDGKLVESVQVSGGGSVDAAVQAGARAMLLKLFPMRVVQVAGDTIYVNRGADAGVRVGARLRIFRLGQPIIDQQTGALLSQGARTLAGEAVVTDVQENVSAARLSAGASADVDDLAELGGAAPKAAPTAKKASAPKPKPSTPAKEEEGLHF